MPEDYHQDYDVHYITNNLDLPEERKNLSFIKKHFKPRSLGKVIDTAIPNSEIKFVSSIVIFQESFDNHSPVPSLSFEKCAVFALVTDSNGKKDFNSLNYCEFEKTKQLFNKAPKYKFLSNLISYVITPCTIVAYVIVGLLASKIAIVTGCYLFLFFVLCFLACRCNNLSHKADDDYDKYIDKMPGVGLGTIINSLKQMNNHALDEQTGAVMLINESINNEIQKKLTIKN